MSLMPIISLVHDSPVEQYCLDYKQEVRLREVKPLTPNSQSPFVVAELKSVELQGPSFQ